MTDDNFFFFKKKNSDFKTSSLVGFVYDYKSGASLTVTSHAAINYFLTKWVFECNGHHSINLAWQSYFKNY